MYSYKTIKRFSLPVVCFMAGMLCFASCRQEIAAPDTMVTSINVINALAGVPAIKINVTGSTISYASAKQVAYGSSSFYYSTMAVTPFKVVSSADTTQYLVNSELRLQAGNYSVYIAGVSPHIDTLIRQEDNYPYIKTDTTAIDSAVYIRFVNLSPNSAPLSVNIRNAATAEVSALSYTGISPFKKYAARRSNTSYVFEIRDQATGNLLLTYTLAINTNNRYKNVAVVLRGVAGSSITPFGAFVANYF